MVKKEMLKLDKEEAYKEEAHKEETHKKKHIKRTFLIYINQLKLVYLRFTYRR